MRQALLVLSLLLVLAVPALASAPPVGPLPAGPVSAITVQHGEYFAVALPPAGSGGKVWRIARAYDGRIVTEVSETVLRGNVVAVFRALRPGRATISYGLTVGERTKALKARVFAITVR